MIITFHRQMRGVVVVGDIKENEILPQLAFLNQLPNKKVTIPTMSAKGVEVAKTKIYLVDVPNAAQTEFRIGYVTATPYDATGNYYRSYLTNYPLGGAFNSRLNLNLREEKGWTYGARSGYDAINIRVRLPLAAASEQTLQIV
ncbi:MAG: insulinase family protein, partial [Segetibacter sp.]